MDLHDTSVEVLYDFEYSTKDGNKVTIKEGEKLYLIKKTNNDWWQVIRSTGLRPFYVPSGYVKEIQIATKPSEPVEVKQVRNEIQTECTTTETQHSDFTVTVSIKPQPTVMNPLPKSRSNTKVFLNCSPESGLDAKSSNVNSNESLSVCSDNSDDKGTILILSGAEGMTPDSGYSTVHTSSLGKSSKCEITVSEANILDENLSDSLTELAQQIQFVSKSLVETDRSIARSDSSVFGQSVSRMADRPVKYVGSFKTKFEQKLLAKSRYENGQDNQLYDNDFKSEECELDELPDQENNIVTKEKSSGITKTESISEKLERAINKQHLLRQLSVHNITCNNNNGSSSNTDQESVDPVTSDNVETDIVSSSDLNDERTKYRPIAKPRRISQSKEKPEEAIYANCLELQQALEKENVTSSQVENETEVKKSEEGKINRRAISDMTIITPAPMGYVPSGWSTHVDVDTQQPCYVNVLSGEKIAELSAIFNKISNTKLENAKRSLRSSKTYSLIVPNRSEEDTLSQAAGVTSSVNQKSWPQLSEGKMYVVCEGPMNYTKISEGGKRVRKNWNSVYVVLTELLILIYKDIKAYHALASPEVSVDLNGAELSTGEKISGRKHVMVISTLLGLQVALQFESTKVATHWASKISQTITSLPKGAEIGSRLSCINEVQEDSKDSGKDSKKTSIGRSKSVNFKNKDGSIEDLAVAEKQVKIKARLKKFFHKRPTMESLVKKGIWKDEPVFGTHLEQACGNNVPRVPPFVQKCIECIESSSENMKTDGLYRASGNLSQIQKIRLQIDQNNYSVLEKEEDVHVLTGALKLYFRELKEPLIPYKLLNKAIKASTTQNHSERLSIFSDLIKALPSANRDTLKYLLQHLLRVTQYQEHNRMQIPNVAIVFGPTLMWSEHESTTNMAFDLLQQNMVMECLLQEYNQLFVK